MGDYNPPKADQFFGKGSANSQGPFVDVRQRVAPGLFTDIDRYAIWIKISILISTEQK